LILTNFAYVPLIGEEELILFVLVSFIEAYLLVQPEFDSIFWWFVPQLDFSIFLGLMRRNFTIVVVVTHQVTSGLEFNVGMPLYSLRDSRTRIMHHSDERTPIKILIRIFSFDSTPLGIVLFHICRTL
jgi:hypothetical protein